MPTNSNLVAKALHRMEVHLLDGSWKPGTRLPPERRLADELGVSRGTVREAIQRLVARGILASRHGSGVFVTDRLQAGLVSPWRQLVEDNPDLRFDMLEFRRVLECATAQFAALRADEADLQRMAEVIEKLRATHKSGDKVGEARADAELHEVIAKASHNTMFGHLHTSVIAMLREHIALNIASLNEKSAAVSEQLLEQHLAIWDAIRRHEPEHARDAMWTHIEFVRTQLEMDEQSSRATPPLV